MLTRVVSGLGLLALVVGVPALLYWLSGPPPIPTRMPTRDDVAAQIGVEQVITILVAVVWLAWLQFVSCVIVEALAAVRDGGIGRALPFAGPSQRLARMLVGGLLLSGVIAGQVGAVVAAVAADAGRATTTVSQTVTVGHDAPTPWLNADRLSEDSVVVLTENDSTLSSPHSHPEGPKVYTVAPPVGRHHDSLWEIAERHLGDGRRYPEIFALNEGRVQPDGRALHLARLIQPGWQLVMPEDAVGVSRMSIDRLTSPPTASGSLAQSAVQASGPSATQAQRAPAGAPGLASAAGGTAKAPTAATPPAAATTPGSKAVNSVSPQAVAVASAPSALVAAFATSGTFAACLLAALVRHRRRTGGGADAGAEAIEVEVGLRAGADPGRLTFVDVALRALAVDCATSGLDVPQIVAARADDDILAIEVSPPRADAPDRWTVHDDGARWEIRRSALGRAAAAGPAAYPALVSLGRDDSGRDVFVDLEAAGGPIQVTGDVAVAGQVLTALAVQLASVPWTDGVVVSAFGLPREVSVIAADRIQTVADPREPLARFAARAGSSGQDVLTGRVARPVEVLPEYLVAATPVDPTLAASLSTVMGGGRHPFGFVSVGEVPGAAWSMTVDEAGTLTLPLLDITVSAHRIVPRAFGALVDLFAAATQLAPAQQVGPALTTGASLAPPAALVQDDALFHAASARVAVLGSLTVTAPGRLDPSQVPLAEEIVAYLALNPAGVHSGVLAAAVWPRGVGQVVATATIDRVRDWLGQDVDGNYRLLSDPTGRLRLADSVGVDWQVFCTLADRAAAARTPREEAELLRRALRLVRGPIFDAIAPGRFSWLARTTVTRTVEASVVAVAHRLVVLAERDPDPEGASLAAGLGLRMSPLSQVLWRDLLSAQHALNGPEALKGAVAELVRLLDGAGVPLDGETEALIAHLSAAQGSSRA